MQPRVLLSMAKKTFQAWSDDEISTQAASLAYFTVFSIAPILIIATAVAGFVFGDEAVRGEVSTQLQGLVGAKSAEVIQDMMANAHKPATGVFASVLGLIALIFGATGVFSQLQDSLNHIWKAKPPPRSGVWSFVRTRFLSFTMVLGIGFLLLVSLVISAVLSAAGSFIGRAVPGWEAVWQMVNIVVSFGVVTLLFAMIFKVLPDTKVEWRDVWLGAAVTALLFSLGKLGIGLYLGKSSVASSYGAAGSLAIVLLWVYYSAMLVFLGAEFTHVYAQSHGSHQKMPTDPTAAGTKTEAKSASSEDSNDRGPWLPHPKGAQ